MNHMDLITGYVDISKYYGVTSPDYRVFRNKSDEIDDSYLLTLFQMGYKLKTFFKYGRGVHSEGRWRFPADSFNEFYIPIPPTEEQGEIVEALMIEDGKTNSAIEANKQQIHKLKEYKASLINSAVTGKIKVV